MVQTFEVLHQLPETSGSFAIDQSQVNTSVVQSRFSEHDQIIVQAVPVSQVSGTYFIIITSIYFILSGDYPLQSLGLV